MSSVSLNSLYDLNALQKLQISAALKHQLLHFKAVGGGASKEARLRFDRLPYAPFKMLKGERYNLTNPRGDLIERSQCSSDGTETTQGTRRFGTVAQTSHDSARNLDKATQMFSSEDHFPPTVRSAHQTERSAYEPRLSTTPAPAGPAVTAAPAGGALHRSTTSSLASSSSGPSSTQSSTQTQISDNVTLLSDVSNSTDLRSSWREFHNFTQSSTSKPVVHLRTMCPYPPVPLYGTFYFHNLENPDPSEFKYYIQYACYSGYTLAHGDVSSYCQPGGGWSGVTPFCQGRWSDLLFIFLGGGLLDCFLMQLIFLLNLDDIIPEGLAQWCKLHMIRQEIRIKPHKCFPHKIVFLPLYSLLIKQTFI